MCIFQTKDPVKIALTKKNGESKIWKEEKVDVTQNSLQN